MAIPVTWERVSAAATPGDLETVGDAADYSVVVTNAFGAVTSAPATLVVQIPDTPVLVLQPHGDTVNEGQYFALNAAAFGLQPLSYQWSWNGVDVPTATNRQWVFAPINVTNSGVYSIKVTNPRGSVVSLPATLTVQTNATSPGYLGVANRFSTASGTAAKPVFDVDGTRLAGTAFVAQAYAGPSAWPETSAL